MMDGWIWCYYKPIYRWANRWCIHLSMKLYSGWLASLHLVVLFNLYLGCFKSQHSIQKGKYHLDRGLSYYICFSDNFVCLYCYCCTLAALPVVHAKKTLFLISESWNTEPSSWHDVENQCVVFCLFFFSLGGCCCIIGRQRYKWLAHAYTGSL